MSHATTITAQPGLPFVDVERQFDAPPSAVYRAHTDPQTHRQLAPTAVLLDALLHRHRTRQRCRRSTKHDHQPVAQILHLDSTRLRSRLTQNREVAARIETALRSAMGIHSGEAQQGKAAVTN